jgi:hypothetical protein
VLKRTHFIAHDWGWLDQNSFFRHDFVLAAIAADFEGGGNKWKSREVLKVSGDFLRGMIRLTLGVWHNSGPASELWNRD